LPKVAKAEATMSLSKAVFTKNVIRFMYIDDYFETKMATKGIVDTILFELHCPR
jgi:hypothetical protein